MTDQTETTPTLPPRWRARYCSICGMPLDDGRAVVDTGITEFGIVHSECATREYEMAAVTT